MGRILLRRLGLSLLVVWTSAAASFVLIDFAPGDFTAERALTIDAAARARLQASLGLDRSHAERFVAWTSGVARLDFGQSLLYSRPVAGLVRERAANTVVLATAALALATLSGLLLGVYTGRGTRGFGVRMVRGASLAVLSVPSLVGALVLVALAARTGWAAAGGMGSADAATASGWAWALDVAWHLPVPVLALALPLAASIERLQSRALAEALAAPHVTASLARGVSPRRALWRHAWPASVRPLLGLYGLMIAGLFSGSFAVEAVTAWPGLGRLMVDALRARDLSLVAGCAAAGAFWLMLGTSAADAVAAWADPRGRLEGPS